MITTTVKKLSLAVLLISSVQLVFGQTNSGKVVYERKMNLHKRLPPEAEQMKAMIPEFQTSKVELLFTGSQSLFHAIKEEEGLPAPGGEGGPRTFMRGGGPGGDAETFRDYETGLVVEGRELGPKKYIIDDSLKPIKWKLLEDTMTIGGYFCHKAITSVEAPQRMGFGMVRSSGGNTETRSATPDSAAKPATQKVVAWYTEQIESQAGPDSYYGLPGLILKLDVDEGFMVYTPLGFEPLGKDTVKAPDTGKKITRAEYRKMMQEQMQNFRGGMPGGTTIRITQ